MPDNNPLNSSENNDKQPSKSAAANVIRAKIDKLYANEPNAKEELKEVKTVDKSHLSKHQKVMDQLSKSGRSLAEIQAAWHEYYHNLPDNEKHQVWHEFYANHQKSQPKPKKHQQTSTLPKTSRRRPRTQIGARPNRAGRDNTESPKQDLIQRVNKRSARSRRSTHAHSLFFGLAMGSLVVLIMLFGFFNERFVTPFIRPSHNVSATPIIVDPTDTGPVSAEPKIIIPKINIEAPVVYDEPSIEEKAIQKALERGVVHYAITPEPGEMGNAVIVGHSSSNILNSGKYKFAFLLLKSLENGDTFIVHKDKKRYVYKVFDKFVTSPKDISVLNPPKEGRKAIVTLITCDPPGLSTNRLIIQAEQIYPNPDKNKPSSTNPAASTSDPEELPSNAPSLWSRLIDSIFN
jgi:sortase A